MKEPGDNDGFRAFAKARGVRRDPWFRLYGGLILFPARPIGALLPLFFFFAVVAWFWLANDLGLQSHPMVVLVPVFAAFGIYVVLVIWHTERS